VTRTSSPGRSSTFQLLKESRRPAGMECALRTIVWSTLRSRHPRPARPRFHRRPPGGDRTPTPLPTLRTPPAFHTSFQNLSRNHRLPLGPRSAEPPQLCAAPLDPLALRAPRGSPPLRRGSPPSGSRGSAGATPTPGCASSRYKCEGLRLNRRGSRRPGPPSTGR